MFENHRSAGRPPGSTVGELQVVGSGSALSFNVWTVIGDPEGQTDLIIVGFVPFQKSKSPVSKGVKNEKQ